MKNPQKLQDELGKLESVLLSFNPIDRELNGWTDYFQWVKSSDGIAKRLTRLERLQDRFRQAIKAFEDAVDFNAISVSLAHRDRKPITSPVGLSATTYSELFIRECWVVSHQFQEWLTAIHHWFEDATTVRSLNPDARTEMGLIEKLANHDYGSSDEFDDDRSRLFKGAFWQIVSAQHGSWANSEVRTELRELALFVRNELETCAITNSRTENKTSELLESLGPCLVNEGTDKSSNSKQPEKKPRGRRRPDDKTIQHEAEIADRWARARDSGVYKADFAKHEGFGSLKEFDRLLDRVARRKKRDAEKQNLPPANSD